MHHRLLFASGSSFCTARMSLSVCVFSVCVPVCHCVEMGGTGGEAASHDIQMFQSPASQRPTVAQLKEAFVRPRQMAIE